MNHVQTNPQQKLPISLTGILLSVIIFIIGAFFVWAWVADINQHVRGQGRIIPSGKNQSVQHLEGGIIKEILVQEGDQVKSGDDLFVIHSSDANTSRNEALIRKNEMDIRLFRLKAERDNYSDLTFPEDLNAQYSDITTAEKQLFKARREEFYRKVGVLQDQIKQKRLKLDNLRETSQNLQDELEIARQQLSLYSKMVRAGSVSQSRLLDSQSQVRNFQTRISQIEKDIPVVEAEQQEVNNRLEQLYEENRGEIIAEINKTAFEQKQIQERLNNFSDQVSRTRITAPVDGIITARYIDTIGGVVKPGQVIADILPLNDELVVEGQIATGDRPKIYVGLPTKIRIDAYDFRRQNAIDGVLTSISADSYAHDNQQNFYKIRINIDPDKVPKNMEIYPGMIVNFNIAAARISVLSAILRPFLDLKNNALQKI